MFLFRCSGLLSGCLDILWFLDIYILVFISSGKIFSHYLLKYCLPFNYLYSLLLWFLLDLCKTFNFTSPYTFTFSFLICHMLVFLSCYLGNFYWSIFHFFNSAFSYLFCCFSCQMCCVFFFNLSNYIFIFRSFTFCRDFQCLLTNILQSFSCYRTEWSLGGSKYL